MVFQQPAESVTTPNRLFTRAPLASERKKQHIALAVLSSLVMIMVRLVSKGMQREPSPKRISRDRASSFTDFTYRPA
jgi:hypothetical protein